MKLPSITYGVPEGVQDSGPVPSLYVGSTSPVGVVAAALGSLFIDTVGSLIYVKTVQGGTSGWATLTGGGGPVTWAAITGDPTTNAGLVATIEAEAAVAVSDHEAEANPHPVYLTEAEADALYDALGDAILLLHLAPANILCVGRTSD